MAHTELRILYRQKWRHFSFSFQKLSVDIYQWLRHFAWGFRLKMMMRHTQRDITTVLFRLYTAGLSLSLLWSIQLVIRWISNQRTRLAAFSFFFFHMACRNTTWTVHMACRWHDESLTLHLKHGMCFCMACKNMTHMCCMAFEKMIKWLPGMQTLVMYVYMRVAIPMFLVMYVDMNVAALCAFAVYVAMHVPRCARCS